MKSYHDFLEATAEYGIVEQVRFPLAFVQGLPGAMIDEVVVFESGQLGYVVALRPKTVQVALLSGDPLSPGTKLTRTGRTLHIPVGPGQRGQIINSLGVPLGVESATFSGPREERPVDITPPHISTRAPITSQLITGTSVVDLLVPLASGQREAIIGDQKTGKTSFLLATAKAHSQHSLVVYATIGRPWSEIRHIADFIRDEMKQDNVILLASGADDTPSLITITPYAAMTIAEYWRDAGENVLLILQDLSTHARYYREVALLAERFPGRESYPGDIFHAHARLLERAGNFHHDSADTASITTLVVGESAHGDVASYIVSNLISITDGHLLFDSNRFNQGQRPAVDIVGSVTRVGRKVQTPLAKQLYLNLFATLAKYDQLQHYSKFGSELGSDVAQTILVSQRLLNFFSQPAFLVVPFPVQVVVVGMISQGWLNDQPEEAATTWRDQLTQQYLHDPAVRALLDALADTTTLDLFIAHLSTQRVQLETLCRVVEIRPALPNAVAQSD